jgi:ABC-type Fe3+/spermidine/putrescine transport system ATPase subunit
MFDGRIEEVGAPADLYRAPASRGVMAFLGTSNIFEGVVTEVDPDGCRVRVRDGLVIATGERRAIGDPVWVGIRPERFAVTKRKPPNGENVFHGTVAESVYKGTHAEIYVRTSEGATLAVRWDEDTDASLDGAAIGAEVYLSVPRRNVLLFGGRDD